MATFLYALGAFIFIAAIIFCIFTIGLFSFEALMLLFYALIISSILWGIATAISKADEILGKLYSSDKSGSIIAKPKDATCTNCNKNYESLRSSCPHCGQRS